MDSKDKALLRECLTTIGGENGVWKVRVEQKLGTLFDDDKAEVAKWVRKVDDFAGYFAWAWTKWARAWMLARLAAGWIDPERFLVPTRKEWESFEGELRRCSSGTAMRQALLDIITGQKILKDIAACQQAPERTAWHPSNFTDPVSNDPSDFRYIIHSMRPLAGLGKPDDAQQKRYQFLKDKLGKYIVESETGDWNLKCAELYLSEPSVLKSEILSCSVLSQQRTKTYNNFAFGFILEVPKGNVIAASPTDMSASSAQNKARADSLAKMATAAERISDVHDFLGGLLGYYMAPLPMPVEILNRTGKDSHNEVLVLGSLGGHTPIKITGLFVKITSTRELWKTFVEEDKKWGLIALIRKCSAKLDIPRVPIIDDRVEGSGVAFDTSEIG